jgi:hypothetical protein
MQGQYRIVIPKKGTIERIYRLGAFFFIFWTMAKAAAEQDGVLLHGGNGVIGAPGAGALKRALPRDPA